MFYERTSRSKRNLHVIMVKFSYSQPCRGAYADLVSPRHGLRGKCFRFRTRFRGYECSGLRPYESSYMSYEYLHETRTVNNPPDTVPATVHEKKIRDGPRKRTARNSTKSAGALNGLLPFKYLTRATRRRRKYLEKNVRTVCFRITVRFAESKPFANQNDASDYAMALENYK